jgi:hypothetical protein
MLSSVTSKGLFYKDLSEEHSIVVRSVEARSEAVVILLAVLLATPKPAHAYVDPGSGAMLWQIAAAGVIGSLFYVRRAFTWVRDHLGMRERESGER